MEVRIFNKARMLTKFTHLSDKENRIKKCDNGEEKIWVVYA